MLLFEVMLVSGLELQLRVVFGSMALLQLLSVMMSIVINEGHVVAWDVYHHLRTPWCLRPMLLLWPY